MADRSVNPLLDYAGGCIAGAANITTGYPFDTVKVRLQASAKGVYRGPWHCLRSILKYEGVRGLYRGLTAPLIGGALETGINYTVYTKTLSVLKADANMTVSAAVPIAAGTAGVALSAVLAPAELIKCRMQMGNQASVQYADPLECARDVIRREGLRGLTRGMAATLAREVPGNAVFFSVYEALRLRLFPGRRMLPRPTNEPVSLLDLARDASCAIVCGGLAGMAMWASVLPLDVVKTRIQTAALGTQDDLRIWRQLCLLYQQGGRKSLYAGLTPTLLRAFPANAAQWLTWEFTMQHFRQWSKD